MNVRKVKISNASQRQKCAPKATGNTESCKAQYISVITRTPHRPATSYKVEDEDVVIVAEYDKKRAVVNGTMHAKDQSSVINERESRKRKRLRSEDNDSGLINNHFWYVECGPEVIDLDNSDTESDEEDSDEPSSGAESNDSSKEEEETSIPARRPKNRFEILEETSYHIPGQKIWKREMGVRIACPSPGVNVADWWEGAFRDLFDHLTSTCQPTDNAGITIAVADSAHALVTLSCRRINDFTYSDLYNLVGSAGNCAAAFKMDDTFLITICVVRGSISRELMSIDRSAIAVNRSILSIRSDDTLSLPRSLVVARVYAERGDLRSGELHNLWGRIRCRTGNKQLVDARDLVEHAGIKIPNSGCGVREVEQFQNYLARHGIAIMIYEIGSLGQGGGPLYNGTAVVANAVGRVRHTLHLAYYERFRHYQPILNLPIAAGSSEFCAPCNARYANQVDHACSNRCTQCFASPPCVFDSRENLKCPECNRCFFGSGCFARHKAARRRNNSSICQMICLCSKCRTVVKYGQKMRHICCNTPHYLTRSQESSALGNNLQFVEFF